MLGDVDQARRALGARLRDIRLDAGLSARDLARLAGWHFTKISKLEHGTRPPSRDDIKAWCHFCAAEDQADDLVAIARSVDAMYTEWRRKMRSGMKHFQDRYLPLYEQTTHFRAYETTYIPDMLSTAGYTTGILQFWTGLLSLPPGVDAAVAARMQRQSLLYAGSRRFEILIEEQALLTQVGDTDVMASQLDRLLAVLSLPVLTLGIIPARAPRHALAQGSFWIFDEARVQVETVSALVAITQPAEISLYMQVFQLLQRSAVYGRGARELILRALSELTDS